MNYELAKESQDAGFPYRDSVLHVTLDGTFIKVPPLSELIEACAKPIRFGERPYPILFASINLDTLPLSNKWIAADYDGSFGDSWIDGHLNFCCEGKTPEEAVARLWLALNKKA